MSNALRVIIECDGIRREFYGRGDGPVVVAAFRSWLAGHCCELPIAAGANEIDAETTISECVLQAVRQGARTSKDVAAVMNIDEKRASGHLSNLANSGKLKRNGKAYYTGRRPTTVYEPTPELETVWSPSLERQGKAPGLSHAALGSNLPR